MSIETIVNKKIYPLIAKRIIERKGKLNISNTKLLPGDPGMVSSITNLRISRNNPYLISEGYLKDFSTKLDISINELIWGYKQDDSKEQQPGKVDQFDKLFKELILSMLQNLYTEQKTRTSVIRAMTDYIPFAKFRFADESYQLQSQVFSNTDFAFSPHLKKVYKLNRHIAIENIFNHCRTVFLKEFKRSFFFSEAHQSNTLKKLPARLEEFQNSRITEILDSIDMTDSLGQRVFAFLNNQKSISVYHDSFIKEFQSNSKEQEVYEDFSKDVKALADSENGVVLDPREAFEIYPDVQKKPRKLDKFVKQSNQSDHAKALIALNDVNVNYIDQLAAIQKKYKAYFLQVSASVA
ncbi:hypothetical protein ATX70_09295 [Oenococcus oeni]|uniref:hypothetical protein n=1 Tax=Oenococcus oeni TaxID=1247 RepID=UPI0008F907C9|nr:hypothetical protein [Oenococcus oeni]OIM34744.1 hypothetical protein ATX70_09295 [Oenococcus oeni]